MPSSPDSRTGKEPRHWRRRLKSGDVEFFIDTGTSTGTARGVGSVDVANFITEQLAALFGVTIPDPEWKAPRV